MLFRSDKAEALEAKPPEKASPDDASRFEGTTTISQTIAAPVEGAGLSRVLARLQGTKRVKGAEPGTAIVNLPDGRRVIPGSVTIESRAELLKLEGIARVDGDLAVQESHVSGADLLVGLHGLKAVGGRLTLQFLRSS